MPVSARGRMRGMQMNTRIRWIGALAVLFLALAATGQEPRYRVQEIFVPQTSEFTQHHPGSGPGQFDLSPDGKTVAVEFVTQEPDKRFGVWVALWDVNMQRLIGSQQVEHDIPTIISYAVSSRPSQPFPVPYYVAGLRFSPDGRMLFELTGPSLVALSVPELKILYSIEDRVTAENMTKQMFIEGFAMAANRLAILEQISHGAPQCFDDPPSCSLKVMIADLDSGRILAEWRKPGISHSIALSPDGNLLALTISPRAWGYFGVPTGTKDVFIVRPETGEVVTALSSGYVPADAEFLPEGTELVTTPFGAQNASQATVKVWNLKTGELERQLSYPKHGVRGDMSISANGKWLAAADLWINAMDLRFDRTNPRGYAHLLLWNLSSGKLVYDSGNLGPEYVIGGNPIGMIVGQWEPQILVRMSASGDRLAVGGKIISVRSLETDIPKAAGR